MLKRLKIFINDTFLMKLPLPFGERVGVRGREYSAQYGPVIPPPLSDSNGVAPLYSASSPSLWDGVSPKGREDSKGRGIIATGAIVFANIFAIALFSLSLACGDPSRPTIEFMDHMMDSPAVKAQEEPMRTPPLGTIPRGFTPYPYKKDQGDLAGQELTNPLSMTKENFETGQAKYETFCAVCHGDGGAGDGYIVPKFPRPPTLMSEKVINWSDGRIYHVITRGQNLMPPYAIQISPEDRWAITLYVRALQRAAKPTLEDVEALTKAVKEGKYP